MTLNQQSAKASFFEPDVLVVGLDNAKSILSDVVSSIQEKHNRHVERLVKEKSELEEENERLKSEVKECKELITELVKETKRILNTK